MDIYGLLDLIAIMLGAIVWRKMRDPESKKLFFFFSISSVISFILFRYGDYIPVASNQWPLADYEYIALTALCVGFGPSKYRHPVIFGYIAYLVLMWVNVNTTVLDYSFTGGEDYHAYSAYIFLIFLYQLWAVRYGRDHGKYIYNSWFSRSDISSNKGAQQGKG